MLGLTQDIKRMLAALAYQDASEFLSSTEKLKVLNADEIKAQANNNTPLLNTTETSTVTILFNGQISSTLIDYILSESFYVKDANFDILVYGEAKNLSIQTESIKQTLKKAGKTTSVTVMMGETPDLFNKYIR